MTTDPTAAHHAQILDWLSAALTDEATTEIRLTQYPEEDPGRWTVVVEKEVNPAKEATAASRADQDALYNLAGTSPATPAWVDEADMDPDPRSPYAAAFSCQCDDCRELDARVGWKDPVTRTKEAVGEAVDRVLKDLKEHTDAPPAFRREKALKMKGGGSVKSYLEKRYGQPDPAAWWERAGYLAKGQVVENADMALGQVLAFDGTVAAAAGVFSAYFRDVSDDWLDALYGPGVADYLKKGEGK